MLSFDRETLMIVAVVVCLAATFYVYKEFSKAKSDIEGIKGFCNKLVQSHIPPPQPKPVITDDVEDEEEEPVPVKKVTAEAD